MNLALGGSVYLFDELKGRKIETLRKVRYYLAQTVSMPVDLLTSQEFNERASLPSTLEYKIVNEGELVYISRQK